MIQAKTSEVLDVPETVAKCPECKSPLIVDIYEHESESRIITEGGFTVFCKHEYDECFIKNNWDAEHRSWQGEWMPVQDKVYKWLKENVRVK